MESFSTDTLRFGTRTRAWNDIYSSRLSMTDFIPQKGNFAAGLKVGELGKIGLARLVSGPCTIRRTVDHIEDNRARFFSFLIQLNGEGHYVQDRAEAVLKRGDVTLCDNGVPHSYSLGGGDAEMMLVRVPDALIHDYFPYPDALCGRRLPAREGLASTAAGMACSLWRRVEQGFESAHADSIAHQLLDLFTTSYSLAYGAEMSGPYLDAALHARIASFIEENIRDPRLNPRRVAMATGVSTSELLGLFIRRGDSFGGYISRRRLDQAARQLRNPRWRGSTISEIAYGLGYTSVPLFTRNFHGRFGVSPGDYRRADLN